MNTSMIIAVGLVLTGCVSVKTVLFERAAREPKPDGFAVEILESGDITRPYKVIGFVQVNAGKKGATGDVLEKLRSAARQMGADALIDLNNQPIGAGVPSDGGTMYSGYVRDLWKAKAIVWETPPGEVSGGGE